MSFFCCCAKLLPSTWRSALTRAFTVTAVCVVTVLSAPPASTLRSGLSWWLSCTLIQHLTKAGEALNKHNDISEQTHFSHRWDWFSGPGPGSASAFRQGWLAGQDHRVFAR